MSAGGKTDGLIQATASIASFAGLYYVGDLIGDCRINPTKNFISQTILLTLFLYLNIQLWLSGLKSIADNEETLENGTFTTSSKIVRNGIPFLTDNTRHELNISFATTPTAETTGIGNGLLHHNGSNPVSHANSNPAISTQNRNFYNLSFSMILAAMLTGIFAFAR
tara:strand:- start:2189 stop:2686 length:498 start_codon:yes stop_codon:yes gene_type:complete